MIKSLSLNVRHHPGQIKSIPNGSPEAVSCSRVSLPRHDDPFELVEGEREQEADQRDHEQPGIHLLDRKRAPSAPDQEAETTLGADHLGDGNQHQTDADTELEAGHDDRQRPRQRDGPERVPAARLEVPADIEIDAVDLAHAGRRIDDHRKKHADRHHEDFRSLAQPEDQQGQRQDGAFGNRIGCGDQGINERTDDAVEAHRDAEHERRDTADDRPPGEPLETDESVGGELARAHHVGENGEDARRLRKEPRIDEAEIAGQLPHQQQRERRRKAQHAIAPARRQRPARPCSGYDVPRRHDLASLSSCRRARRTSSRRLDQMRWTSAPNSGAFCSSIRSRGRASGTGTISFNRPGCAVMIMMRSPSSTASSTLWVMNTTVFLCSSQMRNSSSCSSSLFWASSAENGSSINRISGSLAKARAIDTRWRMPPDNWYG